MNRIFSTSLEKWLWVLVICVAGFVRLHGLGNESFWIDEVFSARICEGPMNEIIDRIPQDKPPLDYYVQAFMHRLLPGVTPEASHRLHAAAFNMLSVAGIFFLGLLWFGRSVGWLAFLLAAFSPFLLYFAQEARPYSLFLAFAVWQQVALELWYRATSNKESTRRQWLLYLLTLALSVAAVYTLYAAFLLFAAQAVFLVAAIWIRSEQRDSILRRARPLILFLVLLGIVIALAQPLRSRANIMPPDINFWKYQGLTFSSYILYFDEFFFYRAPQQLLHAGGLAVFLLVLLGVCIAWRRNRLAAVQTTLLALAVISLTFPIYVYMDRIYIPKYNIFCLPAILIAAALGLHVVGNLLLKTKLRHAAFALAILYAVSGIAIHYAGRPYRNNWRGAFEYILRNTHPSDSIVVPDSADKTHAFYYLARYNRKDLRVLCQAENLDHPPSGPVWMVSVHFDLDKRHRDNFWGVNVERQNVAPSEKRFEEIAKELKGPAKIDMGQCPEDLLLAGWTRSEDWGNDTVIRYATQRETGLFLPIKQESSGALTLRVFPYSFEGCPDQWIQPILEGHPLEARKLPKNSFTEMRWSVPEGVVKEGLNRLQLKFAYALSPSSRKKNYGDFRTLAAAVQWVKWEATD